jgi:hypothetical protein
LNSKGKPIIKKEFKERILKWKTYWKHYLYF